MWDTRISSFALKASMEEQLNTWGSSVCLLLSHPCSCHILESPEMFLSNTFLLSLYCENMEVVKTPVKASVFFFFSIVNSELQVCLLWQEECCLFLKMWWWLQCIPQVAAVFWCEHFHMSQPMSKSASETSAKMVSFSSSLLLSLLVLSHVLYFLPCLSPVCWKDSLPSCALTVISHVQSGPFIHQGGSRHNRHSTAAVRSADI